MASNDSGLIEDAEKTAKSRTRGRSENDFRLVIQLNVQIADAPHLTL
jgi:hypothetical protein